MTWGGVNWRMHKVRIAFKTGFLATLSFCLVQLVWLPRAPYEQRDDVAVQGVIKKKADVVDYSSIQALESNAIGKLADQNGAKRKLSSESEAEFPPNFGKQRPGKFNGINRDIEFAGFNRKLEDSRASFDVPDVLNNEEETAEERDYDKQSPGDELNRESVHRIHKSELRLQQHRGELVDETQQVFIQVNRTRAISALFDGEHSPKNRNEFSRNNGETSHGRTLPFEDPGYVWREDGPGENGKGVVIAAEDKRLADSLFKKHQFNVFASDQIALNRTLPDHRPPRCRMFRYRRDLPRASVIIVFHNEAKSVLLRTIWSVIIRSPRHLLEEIVLVDDASNLPEEDWYRSWLKDYVSQLPVPTRLLRMPRRSGVVGSRLAGVSAASRNDSVLVFLDSHCECTEGWLEPLLDCINRNSTRVVSPAIDSISDTDFSYTFIRGMARTGGFNWFPEFMWTHASQREMKRVWQDAATPLRTPTIAGGLFAIDRKFFKRLGYYDPELHVWGSENLELSFKVWQCGGSLEVVPCSRVGHVFRSKPPYDFPGNPETVLLRNNKRVLEVWAGRIKHLFYGLTPEYQAVDTGDISSRIRLRDELKCKSFEWYLESVYPENILPLDFQALGRIMNEGLNLCIDVLYATDGRRMGAHLAVNACREGALAQTFSWNVGSQLQHDHFCITSVEGDNHVMLLECQDVQYNRQLTNQQWQYNEQIGTLQHQLTGLCLGLKEELDKKVMKSFVILDECNSSAMQQWAILDTFAEITWR